MGYNAKHLAREYPSIGWDVGLVCKLQKLRVTGSVDHHSGSSRW